jgi:hypothetical protein
MSTDFGMGLDGGDREVSLSDALSSTLRDLSTDPLSAADRLDALADELRKRASLLREADQAAPSAHGFRSSGGMGDRAKMQVVGPDGKVKQATDTGS